MKLLIPFSIIVSVLIFFSCSPVAVSNHVAHAGSTGSLFTSEEAKEMVKLHDKARSDVGVEPIKWSRELAAYAQKWADHLKKIGCKMQHRPQSGKWKQKYGENIFYGTAGFYGIPDAAKSWESEKEKYNGEAISNSNFLSVGHYTQMVWKNTTRMGCAKVLCNGNIIIVCNYDPPGNYAGETPY